MQLLSSATKPATKQMVGKFGENLACRILEEKGCRILDQNWRCPQGEIDIVAYDSHLQTIVFVEVKTRTTDLYGGALHAISRQKYFRLRRLVGLWLEAQSGDLPSRHQLRIDLIAIDCDDEIPKVTHLKGI